MNSKVKELTEYVPSVTVVLIVLGYTNHYFYYYHFGIPIYNYLDVSEIIFSFSSIIPSAFVAVIFIVFASLSDTYYKAERDAELDRLIERIKKRRLDEKQPESKTKRTLSLFVWIISKVPSRYHSTVKVLYLIPLLGIKLAAGLILLIIGLELPYYLFRHVVLLDFQSELIFYGIFVAIIVTVITFAPKGARLTNVIYLAVFVAFISLKTRASYNAIMASNPTHSVEITLTSNEK